MGFLLQAAILGAGIALLPAYVSRPGRASGALIEILLYHPPSSYEMSMTFPSRENPSRAQAAFRTYVGGYDFPALMGEETGTNRTAGDNDRLNIGIFGINPGQKRKLAA